MTEATYQQQQGNGTKNAEAPKTSIVGGHGVPGAQRGLNPEKVGLCGRSNNHRRHKGGRGNNLTSLSFYLPIDLLLAKI